MTWDIATHTEPRARKDYRCDACELLRSIGFDCGTPEEAKFIDQAKADGYQILKGQRYRKISGIWEGSSSVFRARPQIDDICIKYGLYDE